MTAALRLTPAQQVQVDALVAQKTAHLSAVLRELKQSRIMAARKAGLARAASQTPEQRSDLARYAASQMAARKGKAIAAKPTAAVLIATSLELPRDAEQIATICGYPIERVRNALSSLRTAGKVASEPGINNRSKLWRRIK
jgi:predicted Rossmann fold nucleotide-binding protein DprA/Smf involved in DNA uptake